MNNFLRRKSNYLFLHLGKNVENGILTLTLGCLFDNTFFENLQIYIDSPIGVETPDRVSHLYVWFYTAMVGARGWYVRRIINMRHVSSLMLISLIF